MNPPLRIPKNWRRLKKGTQIEYGDKFKFSNSPGFGTTSGPTNGTVGSVLDSVTGRPLVYIRRRPKKKVKR